MCTYICTYIYIHEATHTLTLLTLLINLRYFGYSRYSLTSLTQPTIYIYIYIYIRTTTHASMATDACPIWVTRCLHLSQKRSKVSAIVHLLSQGSMEEEEEDTCHSTFALSRIYGEYF